MKVLLCDTADEVTRLQHALRMLDPAMEIEVTTESDRVIEMAAGLQPDVVATELGLEGLKDVSLVRYILSKIEKRDKPSRMLKHKIKILFVIACRCAHLR